MVHRDRQLLQRVAGFPGGVTLFPKGIDFAGYAKILDDARIWTGYKNTIIYSVVGTIVNMLVTLPVAFALSAVSSKLVA